MNILFIGGGGFIGAGIIRNLLNGIPSNNRIHVVEPQFANISRLTGMEVTIHRGVLSDYDFVKSVISDNNIQVVVHLVSTLIPGSTFEDYTKEYNNMIFPSILLMQYCAEKNIQFVFFSSGGTIYGNGEGMKFKETDMMAPISYYGWSKQMMENSILFAHRTQGLKYLIIRPSNPYGPGQSLHGSQGLIAVAIGKVIENKPLEIWGDGSSIRDYIYIDDLCFAVCQLLQSQIINKTINIGSGIGYSVNEVLTIINSISHGNLRVDFLPSRNVDVSSIVLDIARLREIMDFHPRCLEEGIKEFYNDVRFSNNGA